MIPFGFIAESYVLTLRETTEDVMSKSAPKLRTGNRRSFIGGSDAALLWGVTKVRSPASGGRNAARSSPRPVRRSHRPAGTGDGGSQSVLVRAQHRSRCLQGAATSCSSGETLDGCNTGRHGRAYWGGLRGQVHAAVVVFGGGRRREAHGPAPAQYVGHRLKDGGAFDHHRWRQMGRNDHFRPTRSTSTCS